ncbi:hypothetical protein ABZ726_30395, partial [Streptomyces hundungensis]
AQPGALPPAPAGAPPAPTEAPAVRTAALPGALALPALPGGGPSDLAGLLGLTPAAGGKDVRP